MTGKEVPKLPPKTDRKIGNKKGSKTGKQETPKVKAASPPLSEKKKKINIFRKKNPSKQAKGLKFGGSKQGNKAVDTTNPLTDNESSIDISASF